MGLIDSMKAAAKATSAWLRGKTNDVPQAAPAKQRTLRYIHVSKPLSDVVVGLTQLGLHQAARDIMRREKGITYRTPNGVIRREADALAKQHGFPNKLRRRLRSSMKRRLAELQASA